MEQLNPNTVAWVLAAFAAAIVALWGFVVMIVMTYRRDARADRKRCEDANAKLGEEIKAVRTQQTGKLADTLQVTAVALHAASTAQQIGNHESSEMRKSLDRLCRSLQVAGFKASTDDTPPGQKHG